MMHLGFRFISGFYPHFINTMQSLKIIFALLFIGVLTLYGQEGSSSVKELTKKNISAAQNKLAQLGFWVVNFEGDADETTRYALLSFQRAYNLKQTGLLTSEILMAIADSVPVQPRYSQYPHFEISLSKQILFWVSEDGRVSRILPVSTGTGKKFMEGRRIRRAITPRGIFKVYRKVDGWKKSPLGNMFYPSYIVGGVAVHGGSFFPNRPSTFGCIKVPQIYAPELSGLMTFETIVIIYN